MASSKPRLVFRTPCNERVRYKKKDKSAECLLQKSEVELKTVNIGEQLSFKVVFLGDHSVGKTCLVHMVVYERVLQDKTKTTIGFDLQKKEIQVNGIPMTLVLWDTAGMEHFRAPLVSQYYRHVDGVILVYDITQHKTFENVKKWLSEVRQYCRDSTNKKILLVGNKSDREDSRTVSSEEGKLYAETNGMQFVELSAKQDNSVQLLGEKLELLAEQMFVARERDSMTRSMSNVIRLNEDISRDWVLVDTPMDPIPRSLYASQDRRSWRRLGQTTGRAGQCQC